MQYDDDIAFQRAILANPADTTLKLVYADWLQDRADPRAEFVRLQVQLGGMVDQGSRSELAGWLQAKGSEFDPGWVAFMTTLAQPFEPGLCSKGDPFTDRVGTRGSIYAFELQYRTANEFNNGLLKDLAFLMSVEWGASYLHCYGGGELRGFICGLQSDTETPNAIEVRTALGNPMRRRPNQLFREQDLFDRRNEHSGAHGQLKRYVAGRQMWYFSTKLEHQPDSVGHGVAYHVALAAGPSPHGNRMVGVLTHQLLDD